MEIEIMETGELQFMTNNWLRMVQTKIKISQSDLWIKLTPNWSNTLLKMRGYNIQFKVNLCSQKFFFSIIEVGLALSRTAPNAKMEIPKPVFYENFNLSTLQTPVNAEGGSAFAMKDQGTGKIILTTFP